jgi:hypothetical protein
MVFKCSQGHTSKANEKQVLVAVKRRRVTYLNIATNPAGLTSYSKTVGYETVQEKPYCVEHSRSAPALTVADVSRTFRYDSLDPLKFRND